MTKPPEAMKLTPDEADCLNQAIELIRAIKDNRHMDDHSFLPLDPRDDAYRMLIKDVAMDKYKDCVKQRSAGRS